MTEIVKQEQNQLQVSSPLPVPVLPPDYIKKSVSFDGVEKASYAAKYKAPAFRQLKEEDHSAFATAVLYRVSIITGCPMPSATEGDDMELAVLEAELIALFRDNQAYASLNIEEVALAFRMNATEESGDNVKHYQQVFNLEYLAKVIRRYLDIRGRLEAKVSIEAAKEKEKAKELSAPARTSSENDEHTRTIIQYHYECFLDGILWVDFIMEYEYNLLDGLGILQLDKEAKYTLMGIAKERRLASLRGRAIRKNDFLRLDQLAVDFSNNMAPESELEAIKVEAKRLAVWDFFMDLQQLGITQVFDVKNYAL